MPRPVRGCSSLFRPRFNAREHHRSRAARLIVLSLDGLPSFERERRYATQTVPRFFADRNRAVFQLSLRSEFSRFPVRAARQGKSFDAPLLDLRACFFENTAV
ncbi:hypothetical protein [Bradyrhizobium sp. USDA 4454]